MNRKSLSVTTVKLVKERRLMSDDIIDGPEKAVRLIKKYLADQAREVMMALYLDTAQATGIALICHASDMCRADQCGRHTRNVCRSQRGVPDCTSL